MTVNTKSVTDQIDAAINRWKEAKSHSNYDDCSDLGEDVYEIITLLAATIDRLAPPGSRYQLNAHASLKMNGENNCNNIEILAGILKALRTDYISGNLQAVHELIHADIFTDFLEMADYLITEGYKDPAAMLAGGVLEEQLRKLCVKNNISCKVKDIPKQADGLNSELATTNIYSKLDQKNVTAWLDLRNKAAHGRYAEYGKEQVSLMIQGIRDFICRNPA